MKKTILLVLAILAICMPASSTSERSKHSIDEWLTECMKKNSFSQGMNDCLGQAYEKWDLELNRVYRELSARLDTEARIVLREAQRAWLEYRDRELAWLAKFYGGLDGTMYSTMLAADRVDLLKRRVLELASLLDVREQQ